MTRAEKAHLADRIAIRLKGGDRVLDADAVRDTCDLLSGGDLDCTSLDIIQDMVQTRLRRAGIRVTG